MDIQEAGGGCGDWMELAEDRDRWRALVSTKMNFRVPKMRGISCLNNETTLYFNTYIKKRGNESVNVVLRHVRVTAVAVQKQKVLHILSVCLQPLLSSMQCACAILYC